MRSLVEWFNARRRQVALALLGLVALVVVSSGNHSEGADFLRIPDLGALVIAGFAMLAVVGLFLVVFAKPNGKGPRRPGEVRSIRSVLFLTVVVALAIWLSPPELPQIEEPATTTDEPVVAQESPLAPPSFPTVSGTDFAALIVIVSIAGVLLMRTLIRSKARPDLGLQSRASPNRRQLAEVLAEVRSQLEAGSDPRSAVLIAYATLEGALADARMPRSPPETPTEHLKRVLLDVPDLAGPAIELGRLYELARFSDRILSDRDRDRASLGLRNALDRLAETTES